MTFARILCFITGTWLLTVAAAFVPHSRVAWSAVKLHQTRSRRPLFVSLQEQHRYNTTHAALTKNTNFPDEPQAVAFREQQAIQDLVKLEKLEQLMVQRGDDEALIQHVEHSDAVVVQDTKRNEDDADSMIWRARLLLLGAAALYGTNFSIIKIMGNTMPVGISATLRFGLAALATLPWLLAPTKDGSPLLPPTKQTTLSNTNMWDSVKGLVSTPTIGAALAGFEVGMWNSVGYLAQAVGLQTTDASKSAFICSLAVVIVPLINFMSGKSLKTREIVGAVMAVMGVGFLEFGGGADLALSSGDIASLLQPIVFGVAFWRMETAMRRFPDEAERSSAAQMLAVFVTSAIYCLSTCSIDFAQIQQWLMDPMILGSLAFTGIFTTALSIYMETVALKTLTAAETTLILSTEPLWGAVFASLLIGEQFGIDAAVGAALIVSSCIYSNLGLGGMMEMVGIQKTSTATPQDEEPLVELEDHELNMKDAEKAVIEVGMIGVFVRLVAFLEATLGVAAVATVVAAEEIVEEVLKDTAG